MPKLYSTCPEALFADIFSQNHINWHCEQKNSSGFVKTAFYFSGDLLSKTILEVVDLVFLLVLARFFKHGLLKLCSTCPEPFFADFFSQNHNNWHCERKKFIWFCQNCILLFRGTFEQNNSRSRRFGFFSSPSQILQAWVTKTVFYVSRGTFCGVFSQNQFNWYCERKKLAGFVKNAFYLSGELLSKTILEVVDLVFFLVLARFFKHGLPKLCSTCPEPFFADFFFTES